MDLKIEGILDTVMLASQRKVIIATDSGQFVIYDLLTNQRESVERRGACNWSSLLPDSEVIQRGFFNSTRKAIKFYDIREKAVTQKLYKFKGYEMLGGLVKDQGNGLFGCSNSQVFYLDTRMPDHLAELCHVSDSTFFCRDDVPAGCSHFKDSGLHYFAWYWLDGPIRIACFDESQRSRRFAIPVDYSSLDLKHWTVCGLPCQIPTAQQHSYDIGQSLANRLKVPMTGLAFAHVQDQLSLYAVNAVGDLHQTLIAKTDNPSIGYSWHVNPIDTDAVTEKLKEFDIGPEQDHVKLSKMQCEREIPDLQTLRKPVQNQQDNEERLSFPDFKPLDPDSFDHPQDAKIKQIMDGQHIFDTQEPFENTNRVRTLKGIQFSRIKRKSYLQDSPDTLSKDSVKVTFGKLTSLYPVETDLRPEDEHQDPLDLSNNYFAFP